MKAVINVLRKRISDLVDYFDASETHEAFTIICAIIGGLIAVISYGATADEVKLGTLVLMFPIGAIIGAIVAQIIIFAALVVIWIICITLFFTIVYWIFWAIFKIIGFLYNIVLWEN